MDGPAFLMAWVAFEGLKQRILTSALSQMGWQVKTFKTAIRGQRFYKTEVFETSWQKIFDSKPQNIKKLGHRWSKANKAAVIRGNYVHGFGVATPRNLKEHTENLLALVENRSWVSELRVLDQNGVVSPIGDPLKRVTPSIKIENQDVGKLREILGLKFE